MDVIDLEGIVPKSGGERTPGFKLLLTILIGAALAIPLFSVWLLVYDRQTQSEQATASITEGWGGPQAISGPVLVIPYRTTTARDRRRKRPERHPQPRGQARADPRARSR